MATLRRSGTDEPELCVIVRLTAAGEGRSGIVLVITPLLQRLQICDPGVADSIPRDSLSTSCSSLFARLAE
jgi:hypothetical protein